MSSEDTCWSLIRAAAAGDRDRRDEFARRYLPAVRAMLEARWRGAPMASDVDDAIQEVFVACFREGGALARSEEVEKGFRAFLYGVTRKIALNLERSKARGGARVAIGLDSDAGTADSGLSRLFDREYACAIVKEALATMERRARIQGAGALRRYELLCERMQGKPVRRIAREWSAEPRRLHTEEAKSKREFRSALRQVVGVAERCAPERIDAECDRLLELLE